MNVKSTLAIVAMAAILSGCAIPAAIIAASHGAMPGHQFVRPTHDVPPQVIYRIDNNRYLTLENYDSCSNDGLVFYNDALKNIRTEISTSPLGFEGKVLLDPADGILAFPLTTAPGKHCGDRGCTLAFVYSFDSGKTFKIIASWQLNASGNREGDRKRGNSVYDETKKMIFALKQNELYIANDRNATKRILDKNGPRPTVGEHLPAAKKALPSLRTPSGEDRFVCDDSIRPKPKK